VNCLPLPAPHDPSSDSHFWSRDSGYQKREDWLRHSQAVALLPAPADAQKVIEDYGTTCGPIAFAAITGLPAKDALEFFPKSQFRPWTTRRDMKRAIREYGREQVERSESWPTVGLCLIQFTGPWSKSNFPAAILQHTHTNIPMLT
jgi:hypothetical protein